MIKNKKARKKIVKTVTEIDHRATTTKIALIKREKIAKIKTKNIETDR